jgi:hypothetical protein
MHGHAREEGPKGVNTDEAWPPRPSWSPNQSQPVRGPASDPVSSKGIDGRTAFVSIGRAKRVPPRPADLQFGESIGIGGWLRGYGPEGFRTGGTVARAVLRLVLFGSVVASVLLGAGLGWQWTQEGHAIAAEPSTPVASATIPASPLRMGPVSTGIVAVDDALRGFLLGDAGQAFSQLVAQQVRCGTLPLGGAPALSCLATEAPGTAHELILAACGPKWVTAEAAKAELGILLADRPGLSAVYQGTAGYTAVLSWPDAPDRSLVLTISSAGVTAYGAGCGVPLAAKPGRELELVSAQAASAR